MTASLIIGGILAILLLAYLTLSFLRRLILHWIDQYDGLTTWQHRKYELLLLLIAGIVLSLLKWEQSRTLNTSVYDHGIFVNVLWNSAHGHYYWNSFRQMNFLGDHFSPFLLLLALPYYFMNTEFWPLFAQTIAMLLSLWIIVQLIATKIHPIRPFERLLSIPFFALNLFFQRVHRFDLHPIAFAIPVITALYLFAKENSKWFYILLPLALIGVQEDVPLMVAGLCLYMIVTTGQKLKWVGLLLICATAFYLNVALFIPHFSQQHNAYFDRYATMGRNLQEVAATFLLRPWVAARLLFSLAHLRGMLNLFGSFGGLPLASLTSIALLPPLLEHELSDYSWQYSFQGHYSANLLPFLMIGTIATLSRRKISYKILLPAFFLVCAYSGFSNEPYIKDVNPETISAVRRLAGETPAEESLSVQGAIGVPFSCRENIRMFPDIQGASRIIVAPEERTWPLQGDEMQERVRKLQKNRRWIESDVGPVLVFDRRLK